MSQKLRHEQILQILQKQGFVTVRYLVDALQYSSATINRDLNSLQEKKLVKRSYGGVEAVKLGHLPPLLQREFYHKWEKRRIAEVATALINEGETVFLNGGTTVQYMVPFLLKRKNIKVLTNSLRVAMELGDSDLEVVCLGGRIVERPYVLGGDETVELAMSYRPDKMFFSVGEVSPDGMIGGEAFLYRVLLKNSAAAWLLTDRTKLSDSFRTVLCDFSALTGVISDFTFSPEVQRRYANVQFVTVEPQDGEK